MKGILHRLIRFVVTRKVVTRLSISKQNVFVHLFQSLAFECESPVAPTERIEKSETRLIRETQTVRQISDFGEAVVRLAEKGWNFGAVIICRLLVTAVR
jgi:hypothetical protein